MDMHFTGTPFDACRCLVCSNKYFRILNTTTREILYEGDDRNIASDIYYADYGNTVFYLIVPEFEQQVPMFRPADRDAYLKYKKDNQWTQN